MALVEVGQDLGVAAAPEDVTVGDEPGAHVLVVVELAVLHPPDVARLVRERLVTALDVHDAEPPDAEGDAVRLVGAAVVRAAVRHRVGHAVEDVGRNHLTWLTAELDDTADPAHPASDASRAGKSHRPPPGQIAAVTT